MPKLRDLPKGKFPLRFEDYSKMHDQLDKAAGRFAALGYDDLAEELEHVRNRLWLAWGKIATAEQEGR